MRRKPGTAYADLSFHPQRRHGVALPGPDTGVSPSAQRFNRNDGGPTTEVMNRGNRRHTLLFSRGSCQDKGTKRHTGGSSIARRGGATRKSAF